MAIEIPSSLVEYVLLGPTDDRRQLQDSPILGDVWIAFAKLPKEPQDLLITPFECEPAGKVAQSISRRLKMLRGPRSASIADPNIAFLQGVVAAKLYFKELMRVVLPLTKWWEEKISDLARSLAPKTAKATGTKGRRSKNEDRAAKELKDARAIFEALDEKWFQARINPVLEPPPDSSAKDAALALRQYEERQLSIEPLHRYLALTGLILWAAEADAKFAEGDAPEKMLKFDQSKVADHVHKLFQAIKNDIELLTDPNPETQSILTPKESLVWQVSLNRRARPALEKSREAVKADAVTNLFKVNCKDIVWAVLDSGIHGAHPAFVGSNSEPRIRQSFDFRNIRKIVSLDNIDPEVLDQRFGELFPQGLPAAEAAARRKDLEVLAQGADERRPIDWERAEAFIAIDRDKMPSSNHGTHVAGIIGAKEIGKNPAGMCPDIQLYDFRILTKTIEDTEFAVIAALQYIRYLNSRSSFMRIHGANLSLSIPHDVRNYACGRTPVCIECERLVESGVVVVAAAGNHGYHSYQTKEGLYEGYAAFSITDPGNADGVITVGATHRFWPHTYGVSFFSSRGPTGDGRLKPDLVAPGERIRSTLPNGKWGELDGTSMAAPHVSGAAAMLMARYPELVGRPRRIKQILCDSATDLQRERSFQGNGMLDVLRAFQSI